MINPPLVTVFMAAYNAEPFIRESILSVINQTFGDFELLIVNDGSTDNTVGVIESIKDPRIRLVHNDENRGLLYTRNRLLDLATGKYIAILDSDDIASPNRLKHQVSFMESHPDIALCGGNAAVINESGEPTGINYIEPFDETIEVFMLFGNPYINSTAIFKRDVFLALGGYKDYDPAEDFELFTRIAAKYPVANLNETLVQYRIHFNNISLKDNSKQIKNEVRILHNLRKQLGLTNDELWSAIHLSLYKRQTNQFTVKEYATFLNEVKLANRQTKRYKQNILDEFLFNKWYEILRETKAKAALFLFFDNRLFKWGYCSFKQVRKVFKQSFFSLIK